MLTNVKHAARTTCISSPEEIIDEARNGRMYILVDDEDREDEGDLVIPAQMVTPEAINFMAKHGRGLICLALTKERVDQLGLPPMSRANRTRHETAFTVSIEAKEGITTGISAADRARTIAVAIDAGRGSEHIVTPGHVFPLTAREGGVLVRAGHTEAAVDVARLAGLNPAGVICEIMKEDGTMARLDDLISFAEVHGLKIGTIRDLIAYRRRYDHLVDCVGDEQFVSEYGGEWRLLTYRNKIDGSRNYALLKGTINPSDPTLVRVHAASLCSDMLGQMGPRRHSLQRAMMTVSENKSGLIVLLTQGQERWDRATPKSEVDMDLRSYGIGAQILSDLGVQDMILLTSSPHRAVVALSGYGLNIVGEHPLDQRN